MRGLPLCKTIDVGTAQKPSYIGLMFGELLKRLTQPEPEMLPDEDARLALTALLVRIARADH